MSLSSPAPPPPALPLGKAHARRLREIYRSAGWPSQDPLEIELPAAGMLDRVRAPTGHESLRVTDAGVRLLATALAGNRAATCAHEALVSRVALEMSREGRIAWRGLGLRAQAPVADGGGSPRWCIARPDVFSIRNTSVATYVDPIVHEVKASTSVWSWRVPLRGVRARACRSECGWRWPRQRPSRGWTKTPRACSARRATSALTGSDVPICPVRAS